MVRSTWSARRSSSPVGTADAAGFWGAEPTGPAGGVGAACAGAGCAGAGCAGADGAGADGAGGVCAGGICAGAVCAGGVTGGGVIGCGATGALGGAGLVSVICGLLGGRRQDACARLVMLSAAHVREVYVALHLTAPPPPTAPFKMLAAGCPVPETAVETRRCGHQPLTRLRTRPRPRRSRAHSPLGSAPADPSRPASAAETDQRESRSPVRSVSVLLVASPPPSR